MVFAGLADSIRIERVVYSMNQATVQLNIQAVFIELPKAEAAIFWAETSPANPSRSEPSPSGVVLTPSEAAVRLRRWESIGKILARMQVTTVSGRQTQISVDTPQTILTGDGTGHTSSKTLAFGPRLNLVPVATPDSDSVRLDLSPDRVGTH